jgi:hypothetical protein
VLGNGGRKQGVFAKPGGAGWGHGLRKMGLERVPPGASEAARFVQLVAAAAPPHPQARAWSALFRPRIGEQVWE